MEDQLNSSDPVTALSQVDDDETAVREAKRWAAWEMINGRSPEDLLHLLCGEGWDADTAEQIVESARQDTREQRGVVTREDVLRELNLDYGRATGGLSVAFRSGLFGLYGFTTGIMSALRSLQRLKRIPQEKPGRFR